MTELIDSRAAWVVATAALAASTIGFAAPLAVVVAMKPIAIELDATRASVAGVVASSYIGSAFGGILAGWLAGKVGVRRIVLLGGIMMGIGVALASYGGLASLYVGFGLLAGLLGVSAVGSPLLTYVSLWFEKRRGSAVALISSSQAVAGALFPPLLQWGVDSLGWRPTLQIFAAFILISVVTLAIVFLHPAPFAPSRPGTTVTTPNSRAMALDLPPNFLMITLMVAVFCCCVPMAMPMNHVVAYCGDLGFGSQIGAAMLSVLLGVAFLARQFWGWLADRVGGFQTLLYSSLVQAVGLAGYMATNDQTLLFAVSAVFGAGLAGLLPSYVLVIRECYSARESNWRVPTVMLAGFLGMATGSWAPGWVFDRFATYVPAFNLGMVFNLINLAVLSFLVLRRHGPRPRLWATTTPG